MGNTLSCCPKTNRSWNVYNVLLLGLSGSGKTEIALKITGKSRKDFSSTNGVKCYTIFDEDALIYITEIGGSEMQKIWHHYFVKTMAVIFTINVCDHINLLHSLEALHDILRHKYMSGKPVLVLATMADLVDNIDIIELNESFCLEDLANHFKTHIFMTLVGLSDTMELFEGLSWLRYHIISDYRKLLNRIVFDKEDAKNESFSVLHHGDKRIFRSARMALHRVGNFKESKSVRDRMGS